MPNYKRHWVSILRHDDSYVGSESEARLALDDVLPSSWDHGELEPAEFSGDWLVWLDEALSGELSEDEDNTTLGLTYWVSISGEA